MSNTSDFKKYYQQQSINIKNVLLEFNKSIHQNCFYRNINILRQESDFVKFTDTRWYMRPDVFCQDYYNEFNYSKIILLVNNISSFFTFSPDNLEDQIIVAPYEPTIFKVLNSSI